jgi:type I restriction enzyme, R subunit
VTSIEAQIENDLIAKLQELKYEYRPDIQDRFALERNFRTKFEELNRVTLSETEFQRLLEKIVTPDVFAAAKSLRDRDTIERDDGTPLNYTLVNIKDWCKNSFEVVNQLRINTDNSHHRYDVILLINGVPVVQIELKAHAVSPRRAMQQIVEYKNEQGNGYRKTLLCFMQLFVVSNRNDTWYFANNNEKHFSFNADERFLPIYQFAAEDNKKIVHLDSFAEKFLAKCTLGQMISRYMVSVASEQKLLMMRPYQIYAVKAIVDCIQQNVGNGYVWHTTGSGKTLTSFKASTLLKDNSDIEKCLFVVDRKGLDRQTREEFNRFQQGCVEENTNTATLVRRLLSDDYADKVIVTTIQKLGLALDGGNKQNYKARLAPLANKRIAFIFDECHRSQFGENHKAIKEFFPKAQLFGFTGTPIFEKNARYEQVEGEQASLRTTETLFERSLHEYTITHAIEDRNVLRFHIDYYKAEGERLPKPGEGLKKEKVIETILTKHDAATADRKFNAILATSSINEAIEYFEAFKATQAARLAADPEFRPLNIACVFSPPAEGNPDVKQLQEDLLQEVEDNKVDPDAKKKALKTIIDDYNA